MFYLRIAKKKTPIKKHLLCEFFDISVLDIGGDAIIRALCTPEPALNLTLAEASLNGPTLTPYRSGEVMHVTFWVEQDGIGVQFCRC